MYSIKNISNNPARPIGLMVGGAGKGGSVNVKNHILVSTDGIPAFVTDEQYERVKSAIKRYEDNDMLVCKYMQQADAEKDKAKIEDKNEKAELIAAAKEKYGVVIDKRKSLKTVKEEYSALENAEAAD
jgi:hypothetical protein